MAVSVEPISCRKREAIQQTKILLYWPNIVDYARVFLASAMFLGPWDRDRQPLLFAVLYVFGFFLDGVDGILARRLNQVSSFGAFLDVCIDNGVRQMMWAIAVPGPVGCLLPALEWLVLAATHSQGGAAWKEGCFKDAPWWVSNVVKNGFKSPTGVLCISGLHFLPLWLWLRPHVDLSNEYRSISAAPSLFVFLGIFFIAGRAYCLAVELWTLSRHLRYLLQQDEHVLSRSRKD